MNRLSSIIEEIKRDANGAVLLHDWIGCGGTPVPQELAESRSLTCQHGYFGQMCFQNVEPNWWDRVKHAVAEAIKGHLSIKHKIGLRVSNESSLSMCKACGCCLRLKIWVPIEHIEAHTNPAQFDAFPEHCWQRKELIKHRSKN